MGETQALQNLKSRLTEVESILKAHEAMVRFRNLEDGLTQETKNILGQTLNALQSLVSSVGRGRPKGDQVVPLNRAAIALISSHLQGYISEVFAECAMILLDGKVESVECVINQAPTRGNPNPENIKRLFQCIGFPDILENIHWQKMQNKTVRDKLREIVELRNRIVHGTPEAVQKTKVVNLKIFVERFTKHFDKKLEKATRNLAALH